MFIDFETHEINAINALISFTNFSNFQSFVSNEMFKNIVIKVVFEIFHNNIMLVKRRFIFLLNLLSSFVHFEILNKIDLTIFLVDLKSLCDYKIV